MLFCTPYDLPYEPSEDGKQPICPCCGKTCSTVFLVNRTPIGCEKCLERVDSTEYLKAPDDYYPNCPLCGAPCDSLYLNDAKQIVGCEECIVQMDSDRLEECFT